jgi:hypothetical protein
MIAFRRSTKWDQEISFLRFRTVTESKAKGGSQNRPRPKRFEVGAGAPFHCFARLLHVPARDLTALRCGGIGCLILPRTSLFDLPSYIICPSLY